MSLPAFERVIISPAADQRALPAGRCHGPAYTRGGMRQPTTSWPS